jgi:hypothetical protein
LTGHLFGTILKQTAIISMQGTKEFVFIMGKECVLFQVATELTHKGTCAPKWSRLTTMKQA